jgi:4-carboxymuconolactone decarboxylase
MNKDLKFLIRIASLVSLGKKRKLKSEITKALSSNVKPERLEEAILQCYLFAGFPAVIEGFKVFREIISNTHRKSKKYNVNKFRADGIKTCRKVYGKNFDKLVKNIKSLHPELFDWMIIEGYGKVLSRDILSLKEREILNVSILTSLGWKNQLHSHIRGAINTGAKRGEIEEVIKSISDICGKSKANTAFKILSKI